MKKSRLSDEQIHGAARQLEAGRTADEMSCELEDENGRLKRLVADLSLDREGLKWVIEKKRLELAAERETVIALRERYTKMSERRACGLVGLSRSSFRYEGERRAKDEELTATLKTLAVDTSIPSARVIRELEAAIAEHGKPLRIRMDSGSEVASREFQA